MTGLRVGVYRKHPPSCCSPAPPHGSSHWSTYPGSRVLLQQIETKAFYDWATTGIPVIRPENALRKRELKTFKENWSRTL